MNQTGTNYLSWNWLATDSFDPTTDGTVTTASGQRNVTAGFSIVGYQGEASAMTIGHGLSQTPDWVIVKNRGNGTNWPTHYGASNRVVWLDEDGETEAAGTAYWNDTDPTATVFSVGDSSQTNDSSHTFVAYCFHSIDGYSSFGKSYGGNSSTNGTFVWLGFRPAWLAIKGTVDSRAWPIYDNKRDTYNVTYRDVRANSNAAEETPYLIDFLSNGFKLRISDTLTNATSNEYLYFAIAESPFKYSNSR